MNLKLKIRMLLKLERLQLLLKDALINELNWLKEINDISQPATSTASLQEIKTTSYLSPIESSVVRPIFVLSVILMFIDVIYLYKTNSPHKLSTSLSIATPVADLLPAFAVSTQKVKDEWSVYTFS